MTNSIGLGSPEFRDLYIRFAQRRPANNGGAHLLIACMPKSASTFLSQSIQYLPGFKNAALRYGSETREQELDLIQLIAQHPFDYVCQSHVKQSYLLEQMCSVFGIRIVALVRNLFDVVVSFHDHLTARSGGPSPALAMSSDQWWRPDGFNYPMIYVADQQMTPLVRMPTEFRDWPEEQRYAFIADLAAPWYVNFYVGWKRSGAARLLRYEDVIKDPFATVDSLTRMTGREFTREQIAAAIAKADTVMASGEIPRKNKVIPGRGAHLPPTVKAHLIRLCEYYGNVDFEPIGLRWEIDNGQRVLRPIPSAGPTQEAKSTPLESVPWSTTS